MSIDVMKQALEALEAGDWYIGQLEPFVYSADDTGTHDERTKVQAAIAALRERLAEPKHDYRTRYDRGCYKCGSHYCPANCQLPAHLIPQQPEQDARAHHKMMVAMMQTHWRRIDPQWKDDPELCHAKGYEAGFDDAVAQKAEPPAAESGAGFESLPASSTWWDDPVPQMNYRKWQGLTADEIWQCNAASPESAVEYHICAAHQNVLDFAEAIEEKLREKNNG